MARRTLAVLASSLILAGSLGACSSQTQDQAESAVCASLAQVKTAAAGVKALSATSTVNEVESATKALSASITELKKSAADLNQADLTALEAAGNDIQKAVAGISGSDTLGEAASSVKTSTTALDAAMTEMSNGVQCK
jgi:hypothetical protein